MAFDYKKEYKEFYMPKGTPSIVTVPKMNYIAVRGSGNPNDADGEYKQAIGLLYGIAFTIKMSKKEDHQIDGYFDYVVPPLEGFWWQDGVYDDRLLVKPVPMALRLMPDAEMEQPYHGAKEMILVDNVDDRQFLCELVESMWEELPEKKKKNIH